MNEEYSNNITTTKIIFFIFFLINPFLTFMFFTLYVMTSNVNNEIVRFWGWIGVGFVSSLCATKVPESDLGWIVEHFHLAGSLTYEEYLLLLGKEPLYQTFSYAMHYVLNNNEVVFIFLLSMISIGALYKAFCIFSLSTDLNKDIFIFSVFILLFFPFFFGQAVHIVRQTMAISLFILLFSYKYCKGKNLWILSLCLPFIHSTSAFCVPFIFMSFIKNPISKRYLLYYSQIAVVLVFIQLLSQLILPYLGFSDSLSYAVNRASQDTTFESVVQSYQIALSALLGLGLIYFYWFRKSYINENSEVYPFANFLIILIFFVLLASGQAELQARFNLLVFQFLAFICSLFLINMKISHDILKILCFVMLGIWFYYNLNVSPWTYKGLSEVVYFTFFNYVF